MNVVDSFVEFSPVGFFIDAFSGMEHLTRGLLVSHLVAVTTMILSPPNFLNRLGALSPGVPLISVHGSLTITGM
jgi:hypothetical protein